MSKRHLYRASLLWDAGEGPGTESFKSYSRKHKIKAEGKPQIVATSGFHGSAHYNPEELLIAALSSCHMLSFLAIATRKKVTVTAYEDDATGFLENEASGGKAGKLWIARVVLRPKVTCDADTATLAEIHHLAHETCFIANSVTTSVTVAPQR